jgi:PAS domain S-box-containing protein
MIGYLAAVVLQLLLTGGDLLLLLRYPDLTIHHLPLVLGVVVVALYWGVGPSLVATITGVLLLYSVVLFTPLSWLRATETDVAEFVLFVLICGTISVLSSQTQRARLRAEQARRAAEELATSLAQEHAHSELERQRLQDVLDVLPVGVCLVNATGQVLIHNQAERAIWGPILPEELRQYGTMYQAWWADTGQRLLPEEWAIARAVQQGKETCGDEIVIQTGDGRHRTVLSAASPIRDARGALVGAVAALLDITERKQLEERLRLAEREQLVREREEAEAHAQALAEANRRLDAFLGIASHELKTPVSSLLLGLQILQRRLRRAAPLVTGAGAEADKTLVAAQDALEIMLQQIGRLNRLVNDLLDTSRIQAGRLAFTFHPADLAVLVRQAVEEQRQLAPERTIGLSLPGGMPVTVWADAERIGQVVTNYLTNALKYSGEERPVSVGLQVEAEQARVWVRDEGPGILPVEQAQMWERFHRVPGVEVQSGSGVGLGLGLHICQTIIERHGGQVGVESAPGTGSTFWFTLPLAREAA